VENAWFELGGSMRFYAKLVLLAALTLSLQCWAKPSNVPTSVQRWGHRWSFIVRCQLATTLDDAKWKESLIDEHQQYADQRLAQFVAELDRCTTDEQEKAVMKRYRDDDD
jgi:hypothetical protein